MALNGGAPALIEWQVKDFGLSLFKLQISHPEPERLIRLFDSIKLEDEIEIIKTNETKLTAYIDTPRGLRTLSM